jgi:hypothetical protein
MRLRSFFPILPVLAKMPENPRVTTGGNLFAGQWLWWSWCPVGGAESSIIRRFCLNIL